MKFFFNEQEQTRQSSFFFFQLRDKRRETRLVWDKLDRLTQVSRTTGCSPFVVVEAHHDTAKPLSLSLFRPLSTSAIISVLFAFVSFSLYCTQHCVKCTWHSKCVREYEIQKKMSVIDTFITSKYKKSVFQIYFINFSIDFRSMKIM